MTSEDKDAKTDNNTFDFSSFKELICPLCRRLLYKCTTTLCGHSYCERCLDEYLILNENCFVCDFHGQKDSDVVFKDMYAEEPPSKIRNKPLRSCFSIDDIIIQLVEKSSDANFKA